MQIYLLRHGEAASQGYDDISRPLSTRGEEEAQCAAAFLKSLNIIPDVIFSSPLARAVQTAEIVSRVLNVNQIRKTEHLAAVSNPHNIIEELNKLSVGTVLCVGHEPHLSTLISILITGSQTARIEVKKGALACLDTTQPIYNGSCTLKWLLSQVQMSKVCR